ncbi:MAG: epoxyqueuosine reductase [Candidatus Bathyarchaeota archaeon]|nr:MAG: epoxyqueuosine reductase [Candidatus Bathyarchaeota archaeon]
MKSDGLTSDLSRWIEGIIKSFINESPENSLGYETGEKAWAEPLIGFSAGDDPLYQFYKSDIGDFYWTPLEIFMKTFLSTKATADQLAVISWILPQTEATKADNRRQIKYPSERWARTRVQGEEVNNKLRRYVVSALREKGVKAVAPMLSPSWKQKESEHYGFASTWSERHVAYASGLGTFGLCDGLITSKGKAMRCGSVVATINIQPTLRPYSNYHAYCLHFSEGTCGMCIRRCPAGAISKVGHDKIKCRNYVHNVVGEFVKRNYSLKSYGCGLCQTRVPCESKIPSQEDCE